RLADPFGHAALTGPRPDPFEGLGKIAALGIKVSRHCTYHGVALNVAMDLRPFSGIDPCGYAGLQTVDFSTIGVQARWDEVADVPGRRLANQLSRGRGPATHDDLPRDPRRARRSELRRHREAEIAGQDRAHPDQDRARRGVEEARLDPRQGRFAVDPV